MAGGVPRSRHLRGRERVFRRCQRCFEVVFKGGLILPQSTEVAGSYRRTLATTLCDCWLRRSLRLTPAVSASCSSESCPQGTFSGLLAFREHREHGMPVRSEMRLREETARTAIVPQTRVCGAPSSRALPGINRPYLVGRVQKFTGHCGAGRRSHRDGPALLLSSVRSEQAQSGAWWCECLLADGRDEGSRRVFRIIEQSGNQF